MVSHENEVLVMHSFVPQGMLSVCWHRTATACVEQHGQGLALRS